MTCACEIGKKNIIVPSCIGGLVGGFVEGLVGGFVGGLGVSNEQYPGVKLTASIAMSPL